MNDLNDYLKARLITFKGENQDDECDRAVIAEITDRGVETEIAFDMKPRRIYLRFNTAELLAAIPKKRSKS